MPRTKAECDCEAARYWLPLREIQLAACTEEHSRLISKARRTIRFQTGLLFLAAAAWCGMFIWLLIENL